MLNNRAVVAPVDVIEPPVHIGDDLVGVLERVGSRRRRFCYILRLESVNGEHKAKKDSLPNRYRHH